MINEEGNLELYCESGMSDALEAYAVLGTYCGVHIMVTDRDYDEKASVMLGREKVKELRDFLNKILGDE